MEIFTPSGLSSYGEYFKIVLSISGVLFGLTFAALLFVIQSGFSAFKYGRRMFLELYVHFGSGLLVSLAYLTLMPVFVLFFKGHSLIVNITYVLFSYTYVRKTLDHQSHTGYIHTLNSAKYVPAQYGKIRTYFRYILNLGFIHTFLVIGLLVFVLGYPVVITYFESGQISLSEKGIFYSTLFILILSIVKITKFIPEFFQRSNQELDYKNHSIQKDEKPEVNYSCEKEAFEKYLIGHGISEINSFEKASFLDGKLSISLINDNKPEIWLNISISVSNSKNTEIRDAVCSYAVRIFESFSRSQVDINSIVLSFHISIVGDRKNPRNIFIRSNRLELDNLEFGSSSHVSEVLQMKNILFDELFRDI